MKLGIICNLKRNGVHLEAEDEEAEYDSKETVEAIRDALQKHGLDTVVLETGSNLPDKIRTSGITMAFYIAEGRDTTKPFEIIGAL